MSIPGLIRTVEELKSAKEGLFEYINQLESKFVLLEPKIRAFVDEGNRFDRLRIEANELYKKFPNPKSRPQLFGLMIGIKDIFHANGFSTAAGSNLPLEVLAGNESQVVSKMRKAGALILGKTVTTEFAYFAPGPTRNPHNLAHTPGGSSSGSAAAVSAGLVPFATGTQTIGSISRPASFCGVVGYKPSYGRISARGVIPLAPSVDHVGFFTSNVPDACFMAEFLVDDWRSIPDQPRMPVLGVPVGLYLDQASAEMQDQLWMICDHLSSTGYKIRKVQIMKDIEKINMDHNMIVAAEAASVHTNWFESYSSLYHPKTAELILRGRRIPKSDLNQALEGRAKFRSRLELAREENGIDLWLSPGAPGPALRGLESTGDPVMNLPWTYAGLPTVCIDTGNNADALPLGLQISGSWRRDEEMLDWATRLETEINRRK